MEDKNFICLANSYKHGSRCIAGIEVEWAEGRWRIVRDDRGMPKWIRPISEDTATGEIPNDLAKDIRTLDVVLLTDCSPCGDGAQSENTYFRSMTAIGKHYKPEVKLLERLVDNSHRHLFYDYGKAVTPDIYQGGNHSILLLKVNDAEVYADTSDSEFTKYRVRFTYCEHGYDLPITDPAYLNALGRKKTTTGYKGSLFITCSLGLLYKGWHHKLAACVFETRETEKSIIKDNWFDEYEKELNELSIQKAEIESRILALRMKILQCMQESHSEKLHSEHFTISYTPTHTVMQFDSKAFKEENTELYLSYCRPKQKEASIVIKRVKSKDNEEDKQV